MIATDYRGIRLVRCSICGEVYPEDIHGCSECGSNIITFIREDDKDDNICSGKDQRLAAK